MILLMIMKTMNKIRNIIFSLDLTVRIAFALMIIFMLLWTFAGQTPVLYTFVFIWFGIALGANFSSMILDEIGVFLVKPDKIKYTNK